MLVLIDNYDSFTWNLVHRFGDLGIEPVVYRNDQISAADVMALNPTAIVLSPGPCTPNEAGICLDMVKAAATNKTPLLGVCLGHQTIGQIFGGNVIRAPELMHGKTDDIYHSNSGIFENLSDPFTATRYHSLIVDAATLPDQLIATAHTQDKIIMGLQHKTLPIHGVQFHPESIATPDGHQILQNFLRLAQLT